MSIVERADSEFYDREASGDAAPQPTIDASKIEVAPPVTFKGILPDLLIHAPLRGNQAWFVYGVQVFLTALLSSGFHMMVAYRIGAFFHRLHLRPLCILIEKFIYHWYNCVFPCSTHIGPGIWVPHPMGIILNSRSRLGANIWLRQFVEIVHVWPQDEGLSGVVGDRAQLNSGAILLRGAVIGHDAIVAARTVVTKFVPPGHLAKGIPARSTPLKPEQLPDRRCRWRRSTESSPHSDSL